MSKNNCLLCGQNRDSHETGCYEPLIVMEAQIVLALEIASTLGIIAGQDKKEDKSIAILYKGETEDGHQITYTKARHFVAALYESFKEMRDVAERDGFFKLYAPSKVMEAMKEIGLDV